jgi:hypothetical protein
VGGSAAGGPEPLEWQQALSDLGGGEEAERERQELEGLMREVGLGYRGRTKPVCGAAN